MARTVAIGEQDFGRIIENSYFYVDKTGESFGRYGSVCHSADY